MAGKEDTELVVAVGTAVAGANPVDVYLAKLSASSRRTQLGSLTTVAQLLGVDDPRALPWWKLRYEHSVALFALLEKKGWAPATVNRILAAYRRVLKECFNLGLMNADDWQRAKNVEDVKGERIPAGRELAGAEVQKLFAACGEDAMGLRDRAALTLLYFGGLRRAEVAGALLAFYFATKGELVLVGKRNKQRKVAFNEEARGFVNAWLAVRPQGGEHVITRVESPEGVTGETVRVILKRRAGLAGVDAASFSAHDFRRTFASTLLDKGVDVVTVQKMMGHDDPRTTARYDRRSDNALHAAAQKMPTTKEDT